ncbi:EamA family transporter [Rubrivirga sp.]|uniref:EamA family transporter n=1 Tax=Rubrivirga sp. TaxID=1885344 RepID=UPI003B51B5E4
MSPFKKLWWDTGRRARDEGGTRQTCCVVAPAGQALGLTFWGIVVSAPGLFLLAAPELPTVEWPAFGPVEVGAILFSGGLSTGLAYAIWNESVLQVGASRTAAFSNLVPVVGVVAGVVLRGETVTLLQVAGGALIVAGVVVVRRRGIGPALARATAPE